MISNATEIMEQTKDPSLPRDLPAPDHLPQEDSSFMSLSMATHKDSSTSAWNSGRKRNISNPKDESAVDSIPKAHIFQNQGAFEYDQENFVPHKKPRLDFDKTPSDSTHLPMEVWQHVFSFLDPKTLGILLRVNRTFNSYLASSDIHPDDTPTYGVLRPVNPMSIWSKSRRFFYPVMPKPLAGMTELDMWKLIGATSCQFCKKKGLNNSSPRSASPWERGPGLDGVRIIWPFGIRTCSQCFFARAKKDVDVMLSPLPTFLLEGLVFVLMTPSMHMIQPMILRSRQFPPGLQMDKYYHDSDIKGLLEEFERVKAFGAATLEEWTKGLGGERLRKTAHIARWEQWENSGGLHHIKPQFSTPINCIPLTGSSCQPEYREGPVVESAPLSLTHKLADKEGFPSGSNHQDDPSPEPALNLPQSRSERRLRDVNEAKALRRVEIERRCLELSPPLTAQILSHMDSFLAAIQIPHTLSERDWDVLKPRLISQREGAEKKESDRLRQSQLLKVKTEERQQEEAQLKEAKASLDHEWDEVQRPIRDELSLFAEDFINENWQGGSLLTKDKCAQFAADVLMHVRNKFCSRVQQEDAVAQASGVPVQADSSSLLPARKLILENMKWVFDNKIKPLTEKHQKELFLCNGCDNNLRFYGFEGVIQHYAAKHTTALSRGNVVVYWRAEWPEKPPFHPNPNAARALIQASSQGGFAQTHGYTGQQNTTNLYMATPEQRHRMLSDAQFQSPRSFGHSPYAYMHGPFQPPSPRMSPYYATPHSNYVFPTTSAMTTSAYDQSSMRSPSLNSHPSPATYHSHMSQALHAYPSPAYGPSSLYSPGLHNTSHGKGSGAVSQYMDPERMDSYQNQLNDIAQISRDVWNATSGIKDLPASIRAFVLIYHVILTGNRQFNIDPSITLFSDGLNNHPQMKPMRNLNGLVCKCCADKENRDVVNCHSPKPKLYSLPALISHFQWTHMEHSSPRFGTHQSKGDCGFDWRTDMISLPSDSSIRSSLRTPGMDDFKLQIILDALESTFATPSTLYSRAVEPIRSSATLHRSDLESRSNPRPELDDLKGNQIHDSDPYANLPRRSINTESDIENRANQSMHENKYCEDRKTRFFLRSPRTVIKSENESTDSALMEVDQQELSGCPSFHQIRRRDFRSPQSRFVRLPENDLQMRILEPYEESHPLSSLRPNSRPINHRYAWLPSDQYDVVMSDNQIDAKRPSEPSRYYSLDGGTVLKDEGPLTTYTKKDHITEKQGIIGPYPEDSASGQEQIVYEGEEYQDSRTNSQSSRQTYHLQTLEEPGWRRALAGDDIMEHSLYAPQAEYAPNRAWKRRREVIPAREIEARRQNRASGSPEISYVPVGRKLSGHLDGRRPSSRFDRYEAQRYEPLSSSSRSSSIKDGPHSSSHFIRDQQHTQPQAPRYYIEESAHPYAILGANQSFTPDVRRDVHGYTKTFGGEQAYYDTTKEM
ncbi:hypothetical protein BGW36DRAFT_78931 [Talaromyces proteolyticus]|uniref:F-box domain-containing protein n=1 Tax=Talaromyces proteolyticus TaxID=1131652 RepID=A0AAD4KD53_9EURO|nr:uncharacterized protein BGW36DRAFT_78931 [Talaromyces proteolyticus]KAH8689214.1 hypothetical protein BGW36DRAFT_78931 [Talaromyces proteolyticus]